MHSSPIDITDNWIETFFAIYYIEEKYSFQSAQWRKEWKCYFNDMQSQKAPFSITFRYRYFFQWSTTIKRTTFNWFYGWRNFKLFQSVFNNCYWRRNISFFMRRTTIKNWFPNCCNRWMNHYLFQKITFTKCFFNCCFLLQKKYVIFEPSFFKVCQLKLFIN